MIEALAATAALRSTPEAAGWLRGQLEALRGEPGSFHAAFAQVGRHVGKAPISDTDAARIASAGLLVPAGMGADECARGALVLAMAWVTAADAQADLVRDLLRRGEPRERRAVLRVMAGLPDPVRLVELAIDACRTSAAEVLEAIACDNAYPARWFPDPAFTYMALKAAALGLRADRIEGLAARW